VMKNALTALPGEKPDSGIFPCPEVMAWLSPYTCRRALR